MLIRWPRTSGLAARRAGTSSNVNNPLDDKIGVEHVGQLFFFRPDMPAFFAMM